MNNELYFLSLAWKKYRWSIFYQSSSKEKVYCSPKWSSAYRQLKFQKKKQQGVKGRVMNLYDNGADTEDSDAKEGGDV